MGAPRLAELGSIRALVSMFLSDIVEELDAALEAGLRTLGLAREGVNRPTM